MRHLLFLTASLAVCATPALAQEAEEPMAIMREADAAMTCPQISEEAAQLSATMGREPAGSVFGRLGGVAKAGAAMVIPGVGLATAASDALTAPGRERREAEEKATENRWYYLNGLYAGQRCQAIAEAAASPAPQPAPPQIQPSSLQP